jgi:head-tail adaptor
MIVAERARALGVRGRAGLARHISQQSGRTLHESSLRQWEHGTTPSLAARQHFAAGAWGGTFEGLPDGERQDYHSVLARLERATGSLSAQPGPEVADEWHRLPARDRQAINADIRARVASYEEAITLGREQERADLSRPRAVDPADAGITGVVEG